MKIIKIASFLALTLFFANNSFAQPRERIIKVIVGPDHSDWVYKPGENVKFSITVLRDGNPVKNAVIRYEIGPEKMDPTKKGSVKLANGAMVVEGGTLKTPGFLRCAVTALIDGKEYRQTATAGFNPLNITTDDRKSWRLHAILGQCKK